MSLGQKQASVVRQDLRRISAHIDQAIRAFVDRQRVSDFYDLTRYRLGWQAGREAPFRPRSVFAVIACEACDGTLETALPLAVAISLLHEFATNQAELELNSPISRGRPSVWNVWGKAQAMNAGDGMHALAKMALLGGHGSLPASTILHLEAEFDECCLRLCEVIQSELSAPGAAHVELAASKTSILFGCAGYAGCYLGGGGADMRDGFRIFGELLGSAAGTLSLDPERATWYRDRAQEVALRLPKQVGARLEGLTSEVLRSTAEIPAGSF